MSHLTAIRAPACRAVPQSDAGAATAAAAAAHSPGEVRSLLPMVPPTARCGENKQQSDKTFEATHQGDHQQGQHFQMRGNPLNLASALYLWQQLAMRNLKCCKSASARPNGRRILALLKTRSCCRRQQEDTESSKQQGLSNSKQTK
jgi:hypothetical protein